MKQALWGGTGRGRLALAYLVAWFGLGGSAGAQIVFEQSVDDGWSGATVTMPSIQGGTDQTYVLIVALRSNEDVTNVTGGAGLTWLPAQVEQCAGREQQGIKVFTAQGSPGSAFGLQITKANSKPASAVLCRYSGVDMTSGFEDPVGENKWGENGICNNTGGDTDVAKLTLTSTADGAFHVVGVGPPQQGRRLLYG